MNNIFVIEELRDIQNQLENKQIQIINLNTTAQRLKIIRQHLKI